MTTRTQCSAILQALKNGETITPLTALQRFGSMRLGARIWDLRHGVFDGTRYEIDDAEVKDANGKRYARYWLKRPAPVMPPAFEEPAKVETTNHQPQLL